MYFPRLRLLTPLLVCAALAVVLITIMGVGRGGEVMAQTTSPLPTPFPAQEPAPRAAQASTSAMLVSAVPMASQPQTVTVVGEDDPAAANRFLRYLLAGYGPPVGVLTATVGALPADLPITLTLPAEAEVIGGYVRRGEYEETLIIFSPSASSDVLSNTLQPYLLAQGFTVPSDDRLGRSGQVFLSSDALWPEVLCSPDRSHALFQSSITLAGEPAALRVSISPASVGDICSETPFPAGSMTTGVLPQLSPPPGVQVYASGMGGGDNFYSAEADLIATVPVAELAAHYAAQLEAAGWERLDASSAAAVEWSAWRFTDESGKVWTATFYIVQRGAAPGAYLATLRADA